jgi:hypothetical protein
MNDVRRIALEVSDQTHKLPPAPLPVTNYFVAAHNCLAKATYFGRDEEFSTAKYRENMVLASAWCQLAAGVGLSTIFLERDRQDKLWGDTFDRKNTANDWHAYIAHYMSLAMRSNAQDYVRNMVKAACICQAAVLMVDRYGAPAPRHYEGLPRAGAKE